MVFPFVLFDSPSFWDICACSVLIALLPFETWPFGGRATWKPVELRDVSRCESICHCWERGGAFDRVDDLKKETFGKSHSIHSSMARGRHIPVDTVTSQGCATQSGLSKEDLLESMEKSETMKTSNIVRLDDVRSVKSVCSIRWRTCFNASRTMETSCLRWSRTQEIQSLETKWSKWMQMANLWIWSNLFILNSSGMMYCVHFNVSSTSNTCSSLHDISTVAPYRHKCRTFDLVYITQPQCGASFEIHHDLQASVQKASDLSITTSCTLRVNDDIFCVHDGAWRDCGLGLSQRLQMDEDIRL